MTFFVVSILLYTLVCVLLVAAAREYVSGKKKADSDRFIFGAFLLVYSIIGGGAIALMDIKTPNRGGLIATLKYSPEQRAMWRSEMETEALLEPAILAYTVICPDEKFFTEPGNETLWKTWDDYYGSFLKPSGQGKHCFVQANPYARTPIKPFWPSVQ